MDSKFIDIAYSALENEDIVKKLGSRNTKNTLNAISERLVQDAHHVDTLTLIKVFCAMYNIKSKCQPSQVLVRSRNYNQSEILEKNI